MTLLVHAGERCQDFLERAIHRVEVRDVQADELWGFISCKEKTRQRRGYGEECGDAYCFVAIERTTKVVLAWHLGKRSPVDTVRFCEKLSDATRGRFQVSTDGFTPYRTAVPATLGPAIDFAQLIKVYATPAEDETRYSPGEVIDTVKVPVAGTPDPARICTSHAERQNLSMRMTVRRLTRLTNAFSKKWENHEAALALYFAFYNYARPHMTLTEDAGFKCTPAMKAGLADHVWSVHELLERVAG